MNQYHTLIIAVSILIAGTMISGSILFTNQGSFTDFRSVESAGTVQAGEELAEINLELEGWPSLGDPNAPILMVEYSDYACPFCKKFVDEAKPQIVQQYIDEGIVYYVRKDFIAVGGDRAAEAAHCAGDQGEYWAYHDILLENQAADRGQWSDPEVHRGYANQLGLDAEQLLACFNNRTHQQRVARSSQEGVTNGASGTPFFVINDVPISGAQPYNVFQQVFAFVLEN